MRQRLILTALVLLLSTSSGPFAAAADGIEDACEYMKSHRIQQEDIPRLRSSWLQDSRYNPMIAMNRDYREAVAALIEASENGNYDRAAELCEKHYSKYCMVLQWDLHCRRAYDALGREALADRYRRASVGIGHWILKSGDGQSPETAFVVMDLLEEKFVLAVKGLRAKSQGLQITDGHHYDGISAVNIKTGEAVVLFFNVDAMFASYDATMSEDKVPN